MIGPHAATLGTDTLTVLLPAPTDAHGDPTGPETRTPVHGCRVQPAGTAEVVDGGNTITRRMRVYAPAHVLVAATSRVEWRGTVWQVHGSPEVWHGPSGYPHHQEFVIVRTTG